MNFPVIFDVAIGLVVIYFISSLVLSFLMEYIIVRRNWRGDFLYERLKEMFYSSQGGYYNIIEKVYRHPLVSKLQQYSYRKPESLDSNTFARAFIHVLTEVGEDTKLEKIKLLEDKKQSTALNPIESTELTEVYAANTPMKTLKLALKNDKYLDGDGKRIVDALFLYDEMNNSQTLNSGISSNVPSMELDQGIKNLEEWFIGFKLRLDYLFKREVKWYLFIFGFILCAVLNVDTLNIYKTLLHDEDQRAKMVIMGENFATYEYDTLKVRIDSILTKGFERMETKLINLKDSTEQDTAIKQTITEGLSNIKNDLFNTTKTVYGDGYGLIGWSKTEWEELTKWSADGYWKYLLIKILGILISAFALMFGAPFWHEYLKSMLAVRKVVQPKGLTN